MTLDNKEPESQFFQNLLAINCASEHLVIGPEGKCYSTTCMLNQTKAADDIQRNGCQIHKQDFVQDAIFRLKVKKEVT